MDTLARQDKALSRLSEGGDSDAYGFGDLDGAPAPEIKPLVIPSLKAKNVKRGWDAGGDSALSGAMSVSARRKAANAHIDGAQAEAAATYTPSGIGAKRIPKQAPPSHDAAAMRGASKQEKWLAENEKEAREQLASGKKPVSPPADDGKFEYTQTKGVQDIQNEIEERNLSSEEVAARLEKQRQVNSAEHLLATKKAELERQEAAVAAREEALRQLMEEQAAETGGGYGGGHDDSYGSQSPPG